MTDARSYVRDDGKTRIVAVLEGQRAVLHVTKYGSDTTTLVTASMSQADAYQLGSWLIDNCRI